MSSEIAPTLFDPQLKLEVLGQRLVRPKVQELLSRALSDEKRLSRVAALSYVHQLGFEKFVLLELPNGSAIRLHFWPHDSKLVEEDIHSHCASFRSTVVIGSLTSQLYELKCGDTHMAYTYRFDRFSGHSEVKGGRPVALTPALQSTINVGSSYELNSQALHRVTGVTSGTATVSVWAKRSSDAIVVKSLTSRPEDCARKAGMRPQVVRERLGQILEMIK